MLHMAPAVLQHTLEQLDQAGHTTTPTGMRTSSGRLSAGCRVNLSDMEENAHRLCRFGQWYYEHAPVELGRSQRSRRSRPSTSTCTGVAARLLLACSRGRDDLTWRLRRPRHRRRTPLLLELDSLRHEVSGALRNRDVLTGAYGRAEILPALREWRELARRNVQHCCVAFMDLDNLKQVNDTCGHAAGDQLLAAAVQHVMEHLRPYDKVFRYGGDEFLISLPGTDLVAGRKVIEHIREALSGAPMVVSPAGNSIVATASFGIALLEPDISVEESIDRADKALLVAKAAGRNRACCWDPAVTTGTILQRVLQDDAAG